MGIIWHILKITLFVTWLLWIGFLLYIHRESFFLLFNRKNILRILASLLSKVYQFILFSPYRTYRLFFSTKTSVVLGGVLLCCLFAGSIFPYGGKYEDVNLTGWWLWAVKQIDVLNIYRAPWFLTVLGFFVLNMLFCSRDRIRGFKTGGKKIERILSLIFHISGLFLFLGFLFTMLWAYEKDIIIFPGEKIPLTLENSAVFYLSLNKFEIDYTNVSRAQNWPSNRSGLPKKEIQRQRLLSMKDGIILRMKDEPTTPIKYRSLLTLFDDNGEGKNIILEVNNPIKHKGIYVYQSAYDWRLRINLMDHKALIPVDVVRNSDAGADEFSVDGQSFTITDLVVGPKYIRRDGRETTIDPSFMIMTKGENPQRVYNNKPFEIGGKRFVMSNLEIGTVLSYRYDPGRLILFWSGIIMFFSQLAICWLRAYKIRNQ